MADRDLSYSLKPGILHIWLVDIDIQFQGVSSMEELLSPEEVDRSGRYRFEQDRIRFIIRRGILRVLLSRYTGINPVEIEYLTSPLGKLSLPLNPLQFSVSHSQDRIAYAFTLEQDTGVDIERIKPLQELTQLVETWFSTEECALWSDLNPSDRLESYYHVWTQKEAFMKASGEGLTYPLGDFSVSADTHKAGRLLSIKNEDASHWKMITLSEPGWRVAACIQSESSLKVNYYKTTIQDFY